MKNKIIKMCLCHVVCLIPLCALELSHLPYNIKIKRETKSPIKKALIVYQKEKEVAKIEDGHISIFYQGNLNGDGYEELVLEGYSGGAHCCYTYSIVSLTPHVSTPYKFATVSSSLSEIKDIDGNKKLKFIFWDDMYSYFENLCFVCSPTIKIVAQYENGRLKLNAKMTQKIKTSKEEQLIPSSVLLDQDGKIELDIQNAGRSINRFLYFIYTGEKKNAIGVLKKYFQFDNSNVAHLFLNKLILRMSRSIFWNDLRILNNWYIDSAKRQLWSRDKIVSELFEKMNLVKTKSKIVGRYSSLHNHRIIDN